VGYNGYMSDPPEPKNAFKPSPIKDGADLLRRIGWHPSDMKQIELYARMSPAQKVEQMFRWRGEQVNLLKARLRSEHPEYNEIELKRLLQWHLDLVREHVRYG
jgi:hypothetical protein